MYVYSSAEEYPGVPCVVAMGMFDGVHIGHRTLIQAAHAKAAELNVPLVVFTYKNHPLSVLQPEKKLCFLMQPEEKLAAMQKLCVDAVILHEFSLFTANTAAEDFLRTLCKHLHPLVIAAGYNHTFGRCGRGNADLLVSLSQTLGYEALILSPVQFGGEVVSSSRIRKLIEEEKSEEAQKLLGK